MIFSYDDGNLNCYVPHDSDDTRDTLVGVKSILQADYNSYFMEARTIPDFNSLPSVTGKQYWRNTGSSRAAVNADLSGIDSVSDCFKACHVVTDGDCWIFRLVMSF